MCVCVVCSSVYVQRRKRYDVFLKLVPSHKNTQIYIYIYTHTTVSERTLQFDSTQEVESYWDEEEEEEAEEEEEEEEDEEEVVCAVCLATVM